MLYLTYKATFYNEITNQEETEYGIVAAETTTQALEQLTEFYDDDLLSITLDINMVSVCPYTFSEEIYNKLNEERNNYL